MAALPNIDIDDLKSEYGEYYINEGQNLDRLKQFLKTPADTEQLFPLRITDETVLRNATVQQGSVIQAFQNSFTPKGDLKLSPNTILMYQMKIDLDIYPQDLVSSWAGFLTGQSLDPMEWPFMRWWLEQVVLPQATEDRELYELFKGVHADPTPGVASDVGTAMNGILKLISDAATASKSTMIPMGAIPTGADAAVHFCEYVEDFVKQLPALIRKKGGTIAMSDELNVLYRDGKSKKYNLYNVQETNLDTVRNFPNFTTKGLLSHSGNDLIWYSPDFNKVRLEKNGDNKNVFKVESAKRKLSAYTNWWTGLGFFLDKYIFHSDVGLL